MSESKHHHHGKAEEAEADKVRDHRPYWKRAHHDWRFWVALLLMFTALSVYVWSDDLTFAYHRQPRHAMPADVAE